MVTRDLRFGGCCGNPMGYPSALTPASDPRRRCRGRAVQPQRRLITPNKHWQEGTSPHRPQCSGHGAMASAIPAQAAVTARPNKRPGRATGAQPTLTRSGSRRRWIVHRGVGRRRRFSIKAATGDAHQEGPRESTAPAGNERGIAASSSNSRHSPISQQARTSVPAAFTSDPDGGGHSDFAGGSAAFTTGASAIRI